MTDTTAFSFGAQERSWWDMTLDPEVQAERRALEAEKAQLVSRMAEEQRLQELTQYAGPGLVNIIKTYSAQNIPAVTTEVQHDFNESYPGVNFREVLDSLKREGIVHELTSSTQGFMGARTSHLHLL
ncbi:hypothetical protein [Streptomyces sp. NBC_00151]|uniref:hypothetical protein n=1 Tax=Streptomyces sp. NBC_00151 TaxID=2975669 RepID=UPI002DD81634|nr:hypothetical protein [Streptomyces sp. NBC_00151]WRZ41076.1 hypothetical protein OG915_25380 [Streptomyces sp. NBC_00151]WRZ90016.1 hypothetical protein OHB54_13645 [Streptomyces sp. NBC_01007]